MVDNGQQAMPPYRRIAAKIRQRIERGELLPGDRIPSVREIERTEGVSTATATRVAAVLRSEGFAESIPGVGTIVSARRRQTTGPDRLTMLRAGGSGFRDGERTEVLFSELVPAPESVAAAFGLSEGEDVVQRERVYKDGQGVVSLSTSWLPGVFAESAPELLSTDPLPKMTFGLVEERTGRRAVRRRDVVAIRPVPSDVAEVLGVEPDSPALTMTNCYWDQHGEMTEYAIDFLGPGRELSAEYELD
ncbi:GntR family transcriptional regulator [Streptomyces sp. TRM 70351]|uniref:GntR family transcriptional regulator n=1 Tax=Streptomyces sp. TRM 70351 TaxID=3116552 RepID=UPI002E7BC655|nr:GntR family transcriptional regulator [Streptomyces sp. TRM 70351]MEE1929465.1 GntR family transcriptional regulator [Streptomyces sp. TRM 70351]